MQRLVVALVRGVHGLRGAVRVEVLTDQPEAPLRAGRGPAPRGRDAPLTIAAAEAVDDGPGWRLRFREVTTRDAADALRGVYLEADVVPDASWRAASTTGTRSSGATVRGVDGDRARARSATSTASARPRSSSVGGGPFGAFDLPAVRAFIRIFAPRRGEIVVDAEALDLRRRGRRPDPDRPQAPAPDRPRRAASRLGAGARDRGDRPMRRRRPSRPAPATAGRRRGRRPA